VTRLILAAFSLVFFFWLGLAGSSALRTPGTYAEFRSSASVSGQLTLNLPTPSPTPNPYELPVQCQGQTYAITVYLDDLNTNFYAGGQSSELIFGTDDDDLILGGDGDDCIVARGGDDFVIALQGFDHLFGGDGDDTLIADRSSYIDGGPGTNFCSPGIVSFNCIQSSPENMTLDAHHSVPTIDLTWDSIPYADYYAVYRSEFAGGPFALLGTSYDASYSDVGVYEDTVYYYRITAFFVSETEGDVESDPSDPESAMVPSATLTPTPTTTATATGTAAAAASATSTSAPPTATPMATSTPVPTNTPTEAPEPTETAPEPEASTSTTVP